MSDEGTKDKPPRRTEAEADALALDVGLPGDLVVKVRAWIDAGGEGWLGFGRVRLLRAIDEAGSISGAARAVSMSYRHAWDEVEAINRVAPRPLVERSVGGKGGGGAALTDEGHAALRLFDRIDGRIREFKRSLAEDIQGIEGIEVPEVIEGATRKTK